MPCPNEQKPLRTKASPQDCQAISLQYCYQQKPLLKIFKSSHGCLAALLATNDLGIKFPLLIQPPSTGSIFLCEVNEVRPVLTLRPQLHAAALHANRTPEYHPCAATIL